MRCCFGFLHKERVCICQLNYYVERTSSKETEAYTEPEFEPHMNTAKKPNGYLFDPDEDSDSGDKTPSDMSGDSFCLSGMSVTNLSIFIISFNLC